MVLSDELIHSSGMILSLSQIRSHFLVLFALMTRSFGMLLSEKLTRFPFWVLSQAPGSFRCCGSLRRSDSLIYIVAFVFIGSVSIDA